MGIANVIIITVSDIANAITVTTPSSTIGIRGGLAAHGVTEAQIPRLAALAAVDFAGGTNPRPAGVDDYTRLLRAAL